MKPQDFNISSEKFNLVGENRKIRDKELATKPVSYFADAFSRFKKNKASLVASIIILILILFSIAGPIVSPYTVSYSDSNYKFVLPRSQKVRAIMSKHPCVFTDLKDIANVNLTMPMLSCVIAGKKVAVVCWLQSNADTPAVRIQAYQNAIVALGDFDQIIVMGDFNTEQGLEELQTWTDAGYILGNGGYWGVINTWEDTTPNDNIVTKGFIYENFEKGERVTSDHNAVKAKLSFNV